jgi:hypothetical protein
MGAWVVDVASDDNVAQVRGVKLNLGIDKFEAYKQRTVPPGSFDVIDSTGTDTEPTLDTFGTLVQVKYFGSTPTEAVLVLPEIVAP